MDLKPLIKVLELFVLKAVSVFIGNQTDLPQGLLEQKGIPVAGAALGQVWS